MPARDESEEPLQSLPAGMARRYAEYKPATDKPSPPPTNVGGYDELLDYCRGKEMALPRSRNGLVVIDSLIEIPEAKRDLAEFPTAIGMFYGDVLTHTISGSHWEVVEEGFLMVRISRNTSISVIHVAQRRLDMGLPTLAMNYDHALDIIDRDRRGS
ncbi:DUF6278 family protein [Arthrobacter sp. ZGTC131]|uniref:DUF6278 family protein n=1 Tax=Arthrobacter sp. ZGTC131 TaxID=2058898 RepID=UPI0011B042DB|nr:DUF6278 family protein [Arthrobacter sp. ZGTC131]